MTPFFFEYDSIAPLIGSAVLMGAFGFLGGLLLGRKSVAKRGKQESELEARSRPAELMTGPSSSRNIALEAIRGPIWSSVETCASFSALLAWVARSGSSEFVALIGTGAAGSLPRLAIGLSKRSTSELFITERLLRQLRLESPLIVASSSDGAGILQSLDESDRHKIHQLCLTAIEVGGEIVGTLMTSTPPGKSELPRYDRIRLQAVAHAISGRWHQLLALEQQSRELRCTREMLELRTIIDAQADEPLESLNQFIIRLHEIVGADRVAIYFTARRIGEQLRPIVQCGRRLHWEIDAAWMKHEQLFARIAIESETGQLRNGNWMEQLPPNSPIASSIVIPIRIKRRVLGALCLTSQEEHGSLEGNRQIIEYASEILSKTLQRVFDEATIRRQANRDHLTDLVNRRSLDAYLVAEIERIKNGDSKACSLILADLDHFKSINDRFGHQQGDRVLREAARILSEQVSRMRTGEYSIVARYGGEEFAILLPNVGPLGALRIAEEIRAAISAQTIHIQNSTLRFTISLGVAICPHHAPTVESLIRAADKALYQAKARGRNCVCRAEVEQAMALQT